MSAVHIEEENEYLYAVYGDDTLNLVTNLDKEDLIFESKRDVLVLFAQRSGFRKELLRSASTSKKLVDRALRPKETKGRLSVRLNISKTKLSDYDRLTRDDTLKLIFSTPPLLNATDASHLLMQLGKPGLFISTYSNSTNRRNWILRKILEYGQDHECPVGSWQEYAELALRFLGMKGLSKPEDAPTGDLPPEHLFLVTDWDSSFIYRDDTRRTTRGKYLDRYRQEHGYLDYGSKKRVAEVLQDRANEIYCVSRQQPVNPYDPFFTQDAFRNMYEDHARVDRDKLICFAIAMECTLAETNRMLLEDDRALLYPNQNDHQEIYWVSCLRRNSSLREKTPAAAE